MPTRLWTALIVSCLVPAVAECAAPFVEWPQGPVAVEMLDAAKKAVTSAGPEVDLGLMWPVEWKIPARTKPCRPEGESRRSRWWRSMPLHFDSFVRGWTIFQSEIEGDYSYPITDDALPRACVNLFRKGALDSFDDSTLRYGSQCGDRQCREYTILHPPEVPTLRLDSRCLKLHLDTAGVSKLDTAVVELWLSRDGWIWQRYQHEPHSDSLLVTLPWEGRYGLRVVVHDLKSPDSPTPRMGDAPQLWVEIDESLPIVGAKPRRGTNGEYCLYQGFDLRRSRNLRKEDEVENPCCKIRRVETEKVDPHPPAFRGMQFTF